MTRRRSRRRRCTAASWRTTSSARRPSEYKGVDMDSLEEEEIVCQCARVSLRTVRDVIRINDLQTVEEITRYTKAGAFCKSCIRPGGHESRKHYLVDILPGRPRGDGTSQAATVARRRRAFAELGLIQKHRAVEKVLDEKVRPNLLQDGGNLEVVDMKAADGVTEVYIKYLGACKGCPSADGGHPELHRGLPESGAGSGASGSSRCREEDGRGAARGPGGIHTLFRRRGLAHRHFPLHLPAFLARQLPRLRTALRCVYADPDRRGRQDVRACRRTRTSEPGCTLPAAVLSVFGQRRHDLVPAHPHAPGRPHAAGSHEAARCGRAWPS